MRPVFVVAALALAACASSPSASRPAAPTPAPAPAPVSAAPKVDVAVTSAPPERAAPAEGAAGDTARVEDMVRRRSADVQTCYQEEGLKRNPDLAGGVTLELTVTPDGTIKRADITERSWTGPGSVEAEHCITTKAMAWRVYGVSSGGVFEFPFNLSK